MPEAFLIGPPFFRLRAANSPLNPSSVNARRFGSCTPLVHLRHPFMLLMAIAVTSTQRTISTPRAKCCGTSSGTANKTTDSRGSTSDVRHSSRRGRARLHRPENTYSLFRRIYDGVVCQVARTPASQSLPFTSTAIHLYERVNAMDRLADLLGKYSSNHASMRKLFDRYGVADACEMCIEIGILNPSLQRVAASVFYSAGGSVGWNRPESNQQHGPGSGSMRRRSAMHAGRMDENEFVFHNRFDVGRAAIQSAPMARFSGAHDGISLYLAKILHPIWNNYLTSDRNFNSYKDLADSKDLINSVRDQLLALSGFLGRFAPDELLPKVRNADDDGQANGNADNQGKNRLSTRNSGFFSGRRQRFSMQPNRLLDGGDNDEPMGERVVHGLYELKRTEEARRLEINAIKNLLKLTTRAAEALALISIVDDHQMNRVAVVMSDVGKQQLVQARWHDIIANCETGNVITCSLIEGMFTLYDDESMAMTSVGKLLQEQCTSFYGNVDEELHRGLALLRLASAMYKECLRNISDMGMSASNVEDIKSSSGWSAAMNKAGDAVSTLKRVAANIYDTRNVSEELKSIGAYAGMIYIALAIGMDAEDRKKELRKKEAFQQVVSVVDELMTSEGEGFGASNPHASGRSTLGNVWSKDDGIRDVSMRLAFNCKSDQTATSNGDERAMNKSESRRVVSENLQTIGRQLYPAIPQRRGAADRLRDRGAGGGEPAGVRSGGSGVGRAGRSRHGRPTVRGCRRVPQAH